MGRLGAGHHDGCGFDAEPRGFQGRSWLGRNRLQERLWSRQKPVIIATTGVIGLVQ